MGQLFLAVGCLLLFFAFLAHLTDISEGINNMADAQTQALADLAAAVSNAITAATAKISAAVGQPDDSAQIEAQVKVLNDFAASLNPAPVAPPAS